MGRNTYLLIHKREWDRMKKQEQNCGRPITNKEDYIKSLNEQSQNWIKNWPDTVQVSFISKNIVLNYISHNNFIFISLSNCSI